LLPDNNDRDFESPEVPEEPLVLFVVDLIVVTDFRVFVVPLLEKL